MISKEILDRNCLNTVVYTVQFISFLITLTSTAVGSFPATPWQNSYSASRWFRARTGWNPGGRLIIVSNESFVSVAVEVLESL